MAEAAGRSGEGPGGPAKVRGGAIERQGKLPGSFAPWLLGLFVLGLLVGLFLPLFPCDRCWEKREELTSWLSVPYAAQYRDQHPEEVAEVKAHLRRMDDTCVCFRGRVGFLQSRRSNWFQSQ